VKKTYTDASKTTGGASIGRTNVFQRLPLEVKAPRFSRVSEFRPCTPCAQYARSSEKFSRIPRLALALLRPRMAMGLFLSLNRSLPGLFTLSGKAATQCRWWGQARRSEGVKAQSFIVLFIAGTLGRPWHRRTHEKQISPATPRHPCIASAPQDLPGHFFLRWMIRAIAYFPDRLAERYTGWRVGVRPGFGLTLRFSKNQVLEEISVAPAGIRPNAGELI
jgi:hypothetical protein